MVKRTQSDADLSGGLQRVSTPGVQREFLCARCGRRRRSSESGLWSHSGLKGIGTHVHNNCNASSSSSSSSSASSTVTSEVCSGCFTQLQQRRQKARVKQDKKATREANRMTQVKKKETEEGMVLCPILLDAEENNGTGEKYELNGKNDVAPSTMEPAVFCALLREHMTAETSQHYYRRWSALVGALGVSRQKGLHQFLSDVAFDPAHAVVTTKRLADAAAEKLDMFGAGHARDIARMQKIADGLLERQRHAPEWAARAQILASTSASSRERSSSTSSASAVLTLQSDLGHLRSIMAFGGCRYLETAVAALKCLVPDVCSFGRPPSTLAQAPLPPPSSAKSGATAPPSRSPAQESRCEAVVVSDDDHDDAEIAAHDDDDGSAAASAQLTRYKFWQCVLAAMHAAKDQSLEGLTPTRRKVLQGFVRFVAAEAQKPACEHLLTAGQLEGAKNFGTVLGGAPA